MKNRLYVILKKNLKTQEIYGYVEHSFHMSWDKKFVRVWRESELKNYFADDVYYKHLDWLPKVEKDFKVIFARVNSKKCPVEVEMTKDKSKFYWRNKCFYVKNV